MIRLPGPRPMSILPRVIASGNVTIRSRQIAQFGARSAVRSKIFHAYGTAPETAFAISVNRMLTWGTVDAVTILRLSAPVPDHDIATRHCQAPALAGCLPSGHNAGGRRRAPYVPTRARYRPAVRASVAPMDAASPVRPRWFLLLRVLLSREPATGPAVFSVTVRADPGWPQQPADCVLCVSALQRRPVLGDGRLQFAYGVRACAGERCIPGH
jgi:hypothetical protein